MKKKTAVIIIAVLVIILLIGAVGYIFLKNMGILQIGTVYVSGDSCLFLGDERREPIILLNRTKGDDLCSRLQSGDRVLVMGNGTMMLSYPAQMNVYFCLRLGSGDLSDIPEETLEQLREMGW